mmetsp:Transcript_30969/g.70806  ORF Transcript_30969/g.70806 Transcript_30969/m.70806 type:complete len:118 (+) Transcript_30969:115-468(+)
MTSEVRSKGGCGATKEKWCQGRPVLREARTEEKIFNAAKAREKKASWQSTRPQPPAGLTARLKKLDDAKRGVGGPKRGRRSPSDPNKVVSQVRMTRRTPKRPMKIPELRPPETKRTE